MPKEALNITDFSGGINNANDKRDLAENEFVKSDGISSKRPGKLETTGALARIQGIHEEVSAFNSHYVEEGIRNFYYVSPEIGFMLIIRAGLSSGPTGNIFTIASSDIHGLTVGAKLVVRYVVGGIAVIPHGSVAFVTEVVSEISFKVEALDWTYTSGIASVLFILNGDYDESQPMYIKHTTGHMYNRYILKATQYGKFGFYNIGAHKHWYGNNSEGVSTSISPPWYFDTRYTWDFNQEGDQTAQGALISETPVYDGYYEDGVFRTMIKAPDKWANGNCKRPVGLYSITNTRQHFMDEIGGTGYRIFPGWYPLRTHCLSPGEYHHSQNNAGASINFAGAGIINVDNASDTVAEFKENASNAVGHSEYLSNEGLPQQFSVLVGTGNNAGGGDWQFQANSEHATCSFGISLIYDSLDPDLQQESNIDRLLEYNTTDLTDDRIDMSGGGAANDGKLYIYVTLHKGTNSLSSEWSNLLESPKELNTSNSYAIPNSRNKEDDNGFSNFKLWNPRIVGFNIYLTGNFDGVINDPLWLAEFAFPSDTRIHTKSRSHDGVESEGWSAFDANNVQDAILGIPGVSAMSYSQKNGWGAYENIHAWHKTSAIVNRKLYAGNVSYFDKTPYEFYKDSIDNQLDVINYPPKNYPDRILVSPVGKFDILPAGKYLDIVRQDGQNIVKLISLGHNLMIFKHDDVFVLDCSGEIEFLTDSFKGLGVGNPLHVCTTPNSIFWINSQGLFTYDGETAQRNLLQDKIDANEWAAKIFNVFTHINYDPAENNILIFTRYDDTEANQPYARTVLGYDIDNGSLFFKSSPAEFIVGKTSPGIIADNRLYVSFSGSGNAVQETFQTINHIPVVLPSKARAKYLFMIDNASAPGQIGGANSRYGYIRIGSTWTQVNTNEFEEFTHVYDDVSNVSNDEMETAVALSWAQFHQEMNSPAAQNTDYNFGLGASLDLFQVSSPNNTAQYVLLIEAKEIGTAYTLGSTSVTGYADDTAFAFSSDTSATLDATDLYGETTVGTPDANFLELSNTAGTNFVSGQWAIYINRNSNESRGKEYIVNIIYGVRDTGNNFDTYSLSARYITGDPVVNGYLTYINAGIDTSSTYADDCDPDVNDDTRDSRLMTNIREFLMSNPVYTSEGIIDLNDHFTFGAVTKSDESGDYGVPNNNYYINLTLREQSDWADYSDLAVNCYVDDGSGGHIARWEPNKLTEINRVDFETKDYDFGQPNVRKKVHKAYITYKGGDGRIQVFYQANQSGTWTQATVSDSTSIGMLNDSSEVTRSEITFGSGGNNVYSFALKFQSLGATIGTFEINDISIIHRIKKPK